MTAVTSSWLAYLLLVAYAAASAATTTSPSSSFAGLHRIPSNASSSHPSNKRSLLQHQLHQFRGGAISDDDEYDDDDYDSEYDSDVEDSSEPIITTAKKLATSTKTIAQKKKTAVIKSKVKVAMASSSSSTAAAAVTKKKSGGNLYKRYVPYIVRACLNPFTFLAMTKAYFVSLCDINYLKEVSYLLLLLF
ncbi:hypothetical protein ACHAXR_002962 [Thalassiosira sp. AJA248-18]